jgi:acyl-CoA thioesterase FadM
MRPLKMFVYQRNITADRLDELGHANYNLLKEWLEEGRHRLCELLGFSRTSLRVRLGIGLFMIADSYKYHKALKEGDLIFFYPRITVVSPTKITIHMRVIRWIGDSGESELTNEATYEMAMVDLEKERPTRIPQTIIQSIERFQAEQAYFMSTDPNVNPPPHLL